MAAGASRPGGVRAALLVSDTIQIRLAERDYAKRVSTLAELVLPNSYCRHKTFEAVFPHHLLP